MARGSVRIQTDLFGPWHAGAALPEGPRPATVRLGQFDRPTPVSYRVEAKLEDGQEVELWGYFQVRTAPTVRPTPTAAGVSRRPRSPPAALDRNGGTAAADPTRPR